MFFIFGFLYIVLIPEILGPNVSSKTTLIHDVKQYFQGKFLLFKNLRKFDLIIRIICNVFASIPHAADNYNISSKYSHAAHYGY
jgi:3-polyprenyl-4-hydroxybenzoate decarboxylase